MSEGKVVKGTLQKPNRETVALGAVLQDQEVTFTHYTLLVAAAPLSLSPMSTCSHYTRRTYHAIIQYDALGTK